MFKPSDSRPDREKRRGLRLAAVTGLALAAAIGMLLQLPFSATAGIASGDGGRKASHVPPSTAVPNQKPQKASATYQLRCWQQGRLLFDEGPVTLGAEARQGFRLVATDRHGGALIVTVAGETTCQTRPYYIAAPNLALPQ